MMVIQIVQKMCANFKPNSRAVAGGSLAMDGRIRTCVSTAQTQAKLIKFETGGTTKSCVMIYFIPSIQDDDEI